MSRAIQDFIPDQPESRVKFGKPRFSTLKWRGPAPQASDPSSVMPTSTATVLPPSPWNGEAPAALSPKGALQHIANLHPRSERAFSFQDDSPHAWPLATPKRFTSAVVGRESWDPLQVEDSDGSSAPALPATSKSAPPIHPMGSARYSRKGVNECLQKFC